MFSKACEYGIRASIYIVSNSKAGSTISLKEISSHINSPTAFTSKILQKLVKHKVIKSTRGANGGFYVPEATKETITLANIVAAIDGESIYRGCGLGLEQCDENHPCPLHHKFKAVRDGLRSLLESTTVKDLGDDLNKGNVFLKI